MRARAHAPYTKTCFVYKVFLTFLNKPMPEYIVKILDNTKGFFSFSAALRIDIFYSDFYS